MEDSSNLVESVFKVGLGGNAQISSNTLKNVATALGRGLAENIEQTRKQVRSKLGKVVKIALASLLTNSLDQKDIFIELAFSKFLVALY